MRLVIIYNGIVEKKVEGLFIQLNQWQLGYRDPEIIHESGINFESIKDAEWAARCWKDFLCDA